MAQRVGTALARRRGLLRRCRRWRRRLRGAARTPRGACVALQRKFFLALKIFIQPHGLVFDHVVLHAQTALQLGNQLSVRGPDFLVNIDAFAVLGHAIGKLACSPVLSLLDLAALFRASMLDDREHFLNLILRRRRPHNKNQIVITLFHDGLFPFAPGAQPCKIVSPFLAALPPPPAFPACTSSSPRQSPPPGSPPRRLQLHRSFPPLLSAPLSSSAAARILCGCSKDDTARNPSAALQIPPCRPTR